MYDEVDGLVAWYAQRQSVVIYKLEIEQTTYN